MTLSEELTRFLEVLEQAQHTLQHTLAGGERALISGDTAAIEQSLASEEGLAKRLVALTEWRNRLIQLGQRAGRAGATLTEQWARTDLAAETALHERLVAAGGRSRALRQDLWVHWVLGQRCSRYYGEVLALVAQGGRQEPTYEQHPAPNVGGAVLDTAA